MFKSIAVQIVFDYIVRNLQGEETFSIEDIYFVWIDDLPGAWRALLTTMFQEGVYYEVTIYKFSKKVHLQAYKKLGSENIPFRIVTGNNS